MFKKFNREEFTIANMKDTVTIGRARCVLSA
jgi:hypothetical protein